MAAVSAGSLNSFATRYGEVAPTKRESTVSEGHGRGDDLGRSGEIARLCDQEAVEGDVGGVVGEDGGEAPHRWPAGEQGADAEQ